MNRLTEPVHRPHLFGTLEHSIRWAYEGTPSPRGQGLTGSPEPALWRVLRGQVQIRHEHSDIQAKEGDFVIPTTLPRFQHFSADARIFSCGFRIRWADAQQLFRVKKSIVFPVKENKELEAAVQELRRFSKRNLKGLWNNYAFLKIPFSVHAEAERLFWRLMHDFTLALERRGVSPMVPHWEDDRLSLALNAIEYHPMHKRFDSKILAKKVGLSISQLNRLFKSEFGTSPYQQFDLRRFHKAAELVEKDQFPIKQIAIESGFKNLSHFSAWFRSHAGVSPVAFRKRDVDS